MSVLEEGLRKQGDVTAAGLSELDRAIDMSWEKAVQSGSICELHLIKHQQDRSSEKTSWVLLILMCINPLIDPFNIRYICQFVPSKVDV